MGNGELTAESAENLKKVNRDPDKNAGVKWTRMNIDGERDQREVNRRLTQIGADGETWSILGLTAENTKKTSLQIVTKGSWALAWSHSISNTNLTRSSPIVAAK